MSCIGGGCGSGGRAVVHQLAGSGPMLSHVVTFADLHSQSQTFNGNLSLFLNVNRYN